MRIKLIYKIRLNTKGKEFVAICIFSPNIVELAESGFNSMLKDLIEEYV